MTASGVPARPSTSRPATRTTTGAPSGRPLASTATSSAATSSHVVPAGPRTRATAGAAEGPLRRGGARAHAQGGERGDAERDRQAAAPTGPGRRPSGQRVLERDAQRLRRGEAVRGAGGQGLVAHGRDRGRDVAAPLARRRGRSPRGSTTMRAVERVGGERRLAGEQPSRGSRPARRRRWRARPAPTSPGVDLLGRHVGRRPAQLARARQARAGVERELAEDLRVAPDRAEVDEDRPAPWPARGARSRASGRGGRSRARGSGHGVGPGGHEPRRLDRLQGPPRSSRSARLCPSTSGMASHGTRPRPRRRGRARRPGAQARQHDGLLLEAPLVRSGRRGGGA
jgi:hypothetical protein